MKKIINEALGKGVELHIAGEYDLAHQLYESVIRLQPHNADANHNMGVLKLSTGHDFDSLPYLKTALHADTSVAHFWISYTKALIKNERRDEAARILNLAKEVGFEGEEFIELDHLINCSVGSANVSRAEVYTPSQPEPYVLDSLKLDQAFRLAKKKAKQGDIEDARRIYRNILATFPKNERARQRLAGLTEPPEKLFNQLTQMYRQGQSEASINQAHDILQQYPDASSVWKILGVTASKTGDLDLSISAFSRVISLTPSDAEAHFNLGTVLQNKGNLEKAIQSYHKALSLKPDYSFALENIGIALKSVKVTSYSRSIESAFISILDRKTIVDTNDIAGAALRLVRLHPDLNNVLAVDFSDVRTEQFTEIISAFSKMTLLLKLMVICPLPDLVLERIFIDIRSYILRNKSDIPGSPELLKVQSALALQCHTNEYVYGFTENESKALHLLETSVEESLRKGSQPNPSTILCLASYRGLNEFSWSENLPDDSSLDEVFTRQIFEPKEEEHLKTQVALLGSISNKISKKVRNQYEESPYPRWITLGLISTPVRISDIVKNSALKLSNTAIKSLNTPEVLIAGCGTGKHSIATASRLENSKVLAVDLSLSSLAYAQRKTQELGITNVHYMQADILTLKDLNRQFDIVESAGVLHHMDIPMAGWKILVDCMKPGGLMKIGLYSELARQHVVKIRQEVRKAGIGSSHAEIMSFRSKVINSDQAHHRKIQKSFDFYSLSDLKDLLFHVQEHRFTIPQIQDCLSELGLKFCGFSTHEIVSHFKLSYSGADDVYDLFKWQAYEKANPDAFRSMYQFWCQKTA